MTITMTTDQARTNWRAVIEKTFVDKDQVIIERYNRPVCVLVDYDLWQIMQQYREEHLRKLSKQIDDGDFVTQEEVEAGLRERGLLE